MKQEIRTGMQEAPLFTADDHLHVHQQIEKRAHELWREGGCCDQSALSDWLRAEREVLEQFVLAYALRPPARQEPGRKPIADDKPPNQKTRLPRQRSTNKSQKHTNNRAPPPQS